ncbi:MAG: phenylalanine--tRNA ligase subunit beta, partial [Myxococcota bacterium]|nr:phenylalanine--tRNA ligase subunit beta [Myxococcota bacterium]
MRISLDWLGEWVDLPPTAELVDRLDMGGFEDTMVEDTGPDLSAVRVGLVVEREQHPNADRLSLCRVDLGGGEPVEIVCGAPNVAAGQKVAVASPGTFLPDGTKLKKSKIRGVTSLGMICSTRELGLGDDHEGILVLDPDAPVGAPLPEVLASGERVLEVGITPNRGDTASVLGLAREVHAHFGGGVCLPETEPVEDGPPASDAVRVSIESGAACHHYVARVVRGVAVGPSPAWLVRRLEASGIRSINNVVDVTNYVLLEFGQPLHGFDLAKLAGAEIRVRQARAGEKLATLDRETRELDAADLVIADAERVVALAGVMGGADSEVSESTRDVLIESAHFHPTPVRLSARRHGLRTEASYRFERGVDREGVRRAADRCARLLAEVAGGTVAAGAVEARGEAPATTAEVRLDCGRANRLLGTSLEAAEMKVLLGRVGVEAREADAGVLVGTIPSHRNDLHLSQDLIEEVARIHGYDRIPTTVPTGALAPVETPALRARMDGARDALAGAGLLETVTFPFLAPAELEGLGLPEDDPRRSAVRVLNPIKEEEPLLRTLLVPTLLRLARQNLSRQAERIRIFEVSRVFRPRGGGALPEEPVEATGLLAEAGSRRLWQGAPPPLFFQIRGIAERLLNALGYEPTLRGEGTPPYLHPGASAALLVGGQVIGALGEIHPEVARHFEIDVPCAAFEVDLGALESLPRRAIRFHEVSRFPRVRRDLAVLVDVTQPAGEILAAIRKAAGKDCISVELFDRYEGRGVPEGRVSLAFGLVFQRADRTLKDSEVNPAVDKVVRTLA